VVLGGFIAERWGWQAGFGAVGVPGLALAIVFLMIVRDYKTVALPNVARHQPSRRAAGVVVGELLRPRTAWVTCIGAGLSLLVVSTIWAWLPSFFNRYYGVAPDRAGLMTGVIVLIGGLSALLWSVVADRLSSRVPRARLLVPAATAALTAVCMSAAFALLAPGPAQFALIALGALLMLGSVGPTDAVVIDVIHPSLRATAVSILSLTRNLFGLASGPLITGALSDAYGLDFALSVVPLIGLVAAAVLVVASRTYERDLAQVAKAEPTPRNELTPQAA
jgi:predicted MFS family arabinose efflux permease